MKIAFTQAYYLPVVDGPGQVIHEIASRLAKKGHDVHVYCSDSDKYNRIKKKEETIDGVKVHRCFNWFTIANFATFWPSVIRKLRKGNFDIIHSHVSGHSYVLFSGMVSRMKKIPHVHTTHCCWTSGFRSFFGNIATKIVYATLLPLMFKWTDKIIAITPWELKDIEKHGGKKEKVTVIPNGMDNILFKRIKDNKFRKKQDIPEDAKLVLFFGRMNPTKGVDKLAEAALKILKQRDDTYFVFLGPDEGMKGKVEELLKGQEKVRILDPIRGKEQIAEMYQSADMYCLPSYREGLPLTLFEAMASGLPIVASPVNGIPYEMDDPENGFFVKYGDVAGLVEKITRLLDDNGLREKISKNNKEKAKKYSWDIIADRTFKVYEEAIKEKD